MTFDDGAIDDVIDRVRRDGNIRAVLRLLAPTGLTPDQAARLIEGVSVNRGRPRSEHRDADNAARWDFRERAHHLCEVRGWRGEESKARAAEELWRAHPQLHTLPSGGPLSLTSAIRITVRGVGSPRPENLRK